MESILDGWLNRIHHGDCIKGMNSLPEGCINLAFADPPFNIGYEYDIYEDRKERDHYLDWSRLWMTGVHRVLKPAGTFWLAIGDEYAAELKVLGQQIGFHCRSWVVWYYTFGVNCARKFSRSHAHLFYFVKDPSDFTFREAELENRIPSARQLVYGDRRANPLGRLPDDTWILRPQDLAECFTPDEDTWYFPRVAGTFKERAGFHGCQMPEQLLGRIIRMCSREEDVVLDPFAGSATTLTAAKKLCRRFTGFELSEEYVRRGSERLSHTRRGDLLDGAAEPLVSAPATPAEPRKGRTNIRRASDTAVTTAELQQPAKLESLIERGLIDAFQQSHQGYSVDRLVADPDLNASFVSTCQKLGIAGDPRSWNRRLFRLRKAGKLAESSVDRRTEITWQECDPYLYASEIALRQMLDQGWPSIDEILCDPEAARQFDALAASFAPGFTPLQYRWAALRLRKEAKLARTRAAALELPAKLSDPLLVTQACWQQLPPQAGVYIVSAGGAAKQQLYVGESLNLQQRIKRKFATTTLLQRWQSWSPELEIRTFTAAHDPTHLLGYQSLLVAKHKPLLNFKELATA